MWKFKKKKIKFLINNNKYLNLIFVLNKKMGNCCEIRDKNSDKKEEEKEL